MVILPKKPMRGGGYIAAGTQQTLFGRARLSAVPHALSLVILRECD
jgi:hypothetical protein